MKLLAGFAVAAIAIAQTWIPQNSGSTASLRGVSAPGRGVAWASGTGGTCLRTVDGGTAWRKVAAPGAESLDFRDVEAFDARTAYLLSSGSGDRARIYKTTDGGAHWSLQLTNPDAKGFFDALAFWDARHGLAAGDPVDGRFAVFSTDDGGAHWRRVQGPAALPNEGAFAASGTCLVASGRRDAWLVTGGPGAARVLHSIDRGASWTATATPVRGDSASAGIFSIAFADAKRGIIVGGDYQKPAEPAGNIALTSDGARTWTTASTAPSGFRSAAGYIGKRKAWIAVGTSGSDISMDDGGTWRTFDAGAFNAVAVSPEGEVWAVGPNGRIARLGLFR